MTAAARPPAGADPRSNGALMSEHGITCALVPQYFVDGCRYTSLGDALAHAKRRSARGGAAA